MSADLVAASRRIVTPDGISLRILQWSGNEGPVPFLLVHGLASNAHLWDGVGKALAAAGHPTVAVDQRGHGESDKISTGFDFPTLVTDLEAVISTALGGPVVAVGQSWGGNVVLELAAERRHLVAGVVCVDGGFIKLAEAFPSWHAVAEQLAPPPIAGMSHSELEAGLRTWLADFPEAGISAQLANYETLGDGTVRPRLDYDSHMTILRFLWEHDPDDLATRVRQPVLVIAATGGIEGRSRRADDFANRLRSGSVVWMDAHHDVHAQYPDDVAELLVAFAAEVERRSGR